MGDPSVTVTGSLPPGTRPLSHQVAGHMCAPSKTGFLETNDGCILKPLQGPPRGPRERDFYEKIFDTQVTDSTTLQLRSFLPNYLGQFTSPATSDVTYLRMIDVAHRFKNPCIMDIKMGRITYDPEATPEKILKEKSKYPPLEKVGFQIRGARVYNSETQREVFYDKEYLRSLDEETIGTKGLAVFYNKERGLRKDVIREVLHKLYEVQAWFNHQKDWSFFASSLLVVYEGTPSEPSSVTSKPSQTRTHCSGLNSSVDKLLIAHNDSQTPSCSADSNRKDAQQNVDVRMIDFAHVFPTDVKDENYSFGLCKLIRYHEKLLDMN